MRGSSPRMTKLRILKLDSGSRRNDDEKQTCQNITAGLLTRPSLLPTLGSISKTYLSSVTLSRTIFLNLGMSVIEHDSVDFYSLRRARCGRRLARLEIPAVRCPRSTHDRHCRY